MNKIKNFQDGEHLEAYLLVKSILKGTTNNGSPYLTLTLQDSSGTIDGKLWDVKPETMKILEVGKVYNFGFEVLSYRNNLQLKIIKIIPVVQSELDIDEFVIKSKESVIDLRNYINDTLSSIKNNHLRQIVRDMLYHYEADFYEYPAASKIHHSFKGGLATHTCGMLKLANSLCSLYPMLNRDLLLSGVIVHDLGKIDELGGNLVSEYTLKGKLIGHISIGAARLFDVAKNLGLDDSEEFVLLWHMLLSHHGELEFGSPVRPMIVEAEMLTYIDNIDARLNTLETALSNIEDYEMTPKMFALEGRSFYKHNLDDKD